MEQQDDFNDDDNTKHGPLKNQNPYVLVSAFSSAVSFLEAYGWYVLFFIIIAFVIWTNIRDPLKRFFGQRKREYSITDKMSPEQVESRMRSMDEARLRMQEKYDALVQKRAEKLEEQEEEKRQKRINDHNALMHGKTQSGTQHKMEIKTDSQSTTNVLKRNKDSKPLRSSDYNPLTGTSASARYRPNTRPSRGG